MFPLQPCLKMMQPVAKWGACRFAFAALLAAAALGAQAQEPPADPAQAQLDFANGLFSREFFAEAVVEYQKLMEQFPGTPQSTTASLRLGEAASATRQYEQALTALDAFLAQSPDAATAQRATVIRGEALHYLGRHAEALAAFQSLDADSLEVGLRARLLYHRGLSARQTGDQAVAKASFEKLAKDLPEQPLVPYAQYQLALVYQDTGDLENAAAALTEIADSKAPEDLRLEARFRSAELYDKLGWYSAAVGAYEKLVALPAESPYAARARRGLAWAQYHDGKFTEALAAADAALPESIGSAEEPSLHYLRANCLQQLNQLDAALQAHQTLREQFPENPFAAKSEYKIAWINYLRGANDVALAEVNAFLQKHPESPDLPSAAFLLGLLQTVQGDYESAQAQFQRVSDQFPQSEFAPEARYRAAECLQQLGSLAAAATAFESFAQAHASHPLRRDALLNAAEARFASRQYKESVPLYKAALEAGLEEGQTPEVQYRIALALHNAGEVPAASEAFAKLIADSPASPHLAEAHYRLGDNALAVEKDPVKALSSFQAALDAAPEGPWAARALRGAALARYESKDFDSAASTFLDHATRFPQTPLPEEAYVWTGEHFFDKEQWSNAILIFEAMLKALPEYPTPERVLLKIAECASHGGEATDVLPRLQAVVDAAPTSSLAAEARFRMAKLYEGQEEVEKAMQYYTAAAEANNGDIGARSRYRMAELLAESDKPDDAAREFMRVAILYLHEELSPSALLRAGQAYEAAQKPGQAIKAYKELVKDFGDSPPAAEAKEALARLQGG